MKRIRSGSAKSVGSDGSVGSVCLCWVALAVLGCLNAAAQVDLRDAVLVSPPGLSLPEQKAVEMLLDEVEARTLVRWPVQENWPATEQPVIALGQAAALSKHFKVAAAALGDEAPAGAEGFVLRVTPGPPATVVLAGADARGVLFGVGRLLRELRMSREILSIPEGLSLNTAPALSLRGHQLGFRPKVNTYDAWTVPMWEQYYRDLIVFGTNAIELMPPRTDDAADSPHFPLPQIDMMAEMSRLADAYDLDVWIWYPALDSNYADPGQVAFALEEWGEVFARLPRIDAVFVPGGDPGHTEPIHMMALLEKQTANLHKTHPNAEMWMSPQGFTGAWMDQFVEFMQTRQPTWLSGIVFGPQNRLSLAELRKAMPAQYPIRHYPDITHNYSCQFPVQDWDVAYKLTLDRESINPRPRAFTDIFRWSLQWSDQFLTYSEGVNDDFNKMLWSGLGWDPETDPYEIARHYARHFIGIEHEHAFAQALFALEKNWEGPLIANAGVDTTLQQVQVMEQTVSPQALLNWRFQQVVYRAYYDAFVRRRLINETALEAQAMEMLAKAPQLGTLSAMDEAERVLRKAVLEPVGMDLRTRVSDMAEALYNSIRMQLSVPRHHAIAVGRGANFDLIDRPVNNRLWLEGRFAAIRALHLEEARLEALEEILHWTNPGPGGFYDNLGDPLQQPHLVRNVTEEFDPENRTNPLLGHYPRPADRRISWFVDAETRFEAPLKMRYEHLDPEAQYKVRAVYAGDKWDTQMRLEADGFEVHGVMDKPLPIAPVEFDIPREATADGVLELSWEQTPGRGSAGRGTQVAEVWLIRK